MGVVGYRGRKKGVVKAHASDLFRLSSQQIYKNYSIKANMQGWANI